MTENPQRTLWHMDESVYQRRVNIAKNPGVVLPSPIDGFYSKLIAHSDSQSIAFLGEALEELPVEERLQYITKVSTPPERRIQSISMFHDSDTEREGVRITTPEETITIELTSSQHCCEVFGYFIFATDELSAFIGTKIVSISLTDTARRVYTIHEDDDHGANTMFVDILTTLGVIQIAVYNSHNGYYGHDVSVTSKLLTHTQKL